MVGISPVLKELECCEFMLGGVVGGVGNDGVCECGIYVNGDLETRGQSVDVYIEIADRVFVLVPG